MYKEIRVSILIRVIVGFQTVYQEMKDSELESDLPDIKDESELTSEEEMSEEYHYVAIVPPQGNHIEIKFIILFNQSTSTMSHSLSIMLFSKNGIIYYIAAHF